jgi:Cys-tRNA(Pro)/Cys-tRNA(Cys) deacylase
LKTQVTDFLDSFGIEYLVRKHELPALTSESAAEQRGVRISQIAKCMVGAKSDGQLVVMLLPGNKTLKIKKVRKALGGVAIDLINPGVLADRFDLTVGAISPTQFVGHQATFVADPTLLDEEFVDISSGDPLAGVELKSQDLCELLDATIIDIKSDSGD